jgi:hypothetical protein
MTAQTNPECRKALGRAWSAYLDLLMETKLENGTSLFALVLACNPDLRSRLTAVMEGR